MLKLLPEKSSFFSKYDLRAKVFGYDCVTLYILSPTFMILLWCLCWPFLYNFYISRSQSQQIWLLHKYSVIVRLYHCFRRLAYLLQIRKIQLFLKSNLDKHILFRFSCKHETNKTASLFSLNFIFHILPQENI